MRSPTFHLRAVQIGLRARGDPARPCDPADATLRNERAVCEVEPVLMSFDILASSIFSALKRVPKRLASNER